jgi:hypothetical protein
MEKIMFYIIVILAAIFGTPAKADETLKWRQVQHVASMQTLQAGDGHTLSLFRLPGIVFFPDGSTGISQVNGTSDTVNGAGPSNGYLSVIFGDGSELWTKWTGQLGPKRNGTFIVIGGRGRYAGAKGDGTWEANGPPLITNSANTDSIAYVDSVANIKK